MRTSCGHCQSSSLTPMTSPRSRIDSSRIMPQTLLLSVRICDSRLYFSLKLFLLIVVLQLLKSDIVLICRAVLLESVWGAGALPRHGDQRAGEARQAGEYLAQEWKDLHRDWDIHWPLYSAKYSPLKQVEHGLAEHRQHEAGQDEAAEQLRP